MEIKTFIGGLSVWKQPIKAFILGEGPNRTVIFGAFHGDEPNSALIINKLEGYLLENPKKLNGCQVVLVPIVNIDGIALKKRKNANQVDLNRNFPSENWGNGFKDKYHTFYRGKSAGSEPETQAVMKILTTYPTKKIISIHVLSMDNDTTPIIDPSPEGGSLAKAMKETYTANNKKIKVEPVYADANLTSGSLGTFYGGDKKLSIITLELDPRLEFNDSWNYHKDGLVKAIIV